MSKHTAGKWEMPGMDGKYYVVCTHKKSGKRRTIAHVYKEGDARLIAESPNIISELIDCYNLACEGREVTREKAIRMKQIIESATGENIEDLTSGHIIQG